MTSLNDYFVMLSVHDWDYDQDDYKRFLEGIQQSNKMLQISKESPDHAILYEKWYQHKILGLPIPVLQVESVGKAVGRFAENG